MAEEDKNVIKDLTDKVQEAVSDVVEKLFGDKGKEFLDDVKDKAEELSSSASKSLLKLWDSVTESLKLNDNENVQKARETVEDGLKKIGLLKDELDEGEF
ncbi:MAG: hypothetical protein ACTSU5_05155 [Promethearchaeota archaeon]